MKKHSVEVNGVKVNCLDDDTPEAIACDQLLDKIGDVIDSHSIGVIMPAMTNMIGIVSIESGASLEETLNYIRLTLTAMYTAANVSNKSTLQ